MFIAKEKMEMTIQFTEPFATAQAELTSDNPDVYTPVADICEDILCDDDFPWEAPLAQQRAHVKARSGECVKQVLANFDAAVAVMRAERVMRDELATA
jgi:hypothetical protein